MKRVLLMMGLAGLVATGVFAPALADHDPENPGDPAEEACGGEYVVTVEADTSDAPGPITGYCSDGTFQGLGVEPTGNGHSGCGGNYDVTVEADTSDAPGPISGYCSDGTIDGVNDLLPESPVSDPPAGAGSCGTAYAASVQAGTLEDPTNNNSYTYCSDGTLQDLGVPENGDGQSGCGGNYPVTVETDSVQLPGHGISYCSDGTIDGVKDLLP